MSEQLPMPEFRSETERQAWLCACAGKDRFTSESAARAFQVAMHHQEFGRIRRRGRGNWLDLNIYQCSFCNQFHLGNPKTP